MYIALKPCKFAGKAYKIDDPIENTAIQKGAAPRLIKMGVIAAVATDGAVTVEGGRLLPPSSTIEEAGSTDNQETPEQGTPDNQEAGEQEAGSTDNQETPENQEEKTTYTKGGLLHMTKDEMLVIAADMGVEANADMKKEDIADLIMQKQGE